MSGVARAGMLYGPERPEASRAGTARSPRPMITGTRERALRAELERLRHELDVEFAARLREARAFGEVSSNDDHLQIKEEKEVLASRIASLEAVLSSAKVITEDEDEGDRATVAIGVAVQVKDLSSGAVDEYLLIGDFEPPSSSAASAGSPVGRALIGRAVGDEVDVELPGGRKRRLKIVSSRHASRE